MNIIVKCPHCGDPIEIVEINCAVFRHGFSLVNMQQINSHASREECERLLANNNAIGCCKPFQVIKNEKQEYIAVVCDYV